MGDRPVALVTGASRGIGRQLVDHLLGSGYEVIGCSRKPTDHSAPGYRHFEVDVGDEAAVVALLRDIARDPGRLDAVICNAGIASMNAAVTTPGSTAERIMRTNFLGTFFVCREAAKLMIRRRHGRIVTFASIAVALNLPGEAVYAASKAAVITFSKVFARELAPFDITCNVIAPGPVETDLIKGVPRPKLDELVRSLPLGRFSTFEEIANAVDFYLGPRAGGVTGQVLYLGGV